MSEEERKLDCIEINTDNGYPVKYFNIPKHYRDDLKKIIVPYGMILDRTEALASQIFNDFTDDENNSLICLCVLKGGYKFFSDLSQKILDLNRLNGQKSIRIYFDFIRLKSYVNTESVGEVQISGIEDLNIIRGKHVLVVEDLIDTGRSMLKLMPYLQSFSPKSLKCCTTSKNLNYIPTYVGFSIPDDFVVGYAIDYNDQFRDLEHICVIKESAVEKYKIPKKESSS